MVVKNYIYLLILFFYFSCEPIDYSSPIYYDDYYPIELNNVKEYYVTNITHTSFGKDTNCYFLKEIITEKFIDSEGDSAYRIERFWKTDTVSEYIIKDIWTTNKTPRSAEKVEENERFVKMVFPLNEYQFWNGNAYNSQDEQEYTVQNLHQTFDINNNTFDSTVTIIHNYNSNQIEYESEKEVYAIGVGLIYKENLILNINSGNIFDVNYGSEYTQEVINH